MYQLSPTASGYSERILHSFTGAPADGTQPGASSPAEAARCTVRRTYGGNGPCDGFWPGCGTVFKLAPSGSGYTESVIHSFWGGTDGAFPEGGLVVDAAGDLYGTTDAGGRTGIRVGEGSGTVFRIAHVRMAMPRVFCTGFKAAETARTRPVRSRRRKRRALRTDGLRWKQEMGRDLQVDAVGLRLFEIDAL